MRPPFKHLQSQQSSYLLVEHKIALQKVAISLLPSVEWCSVQEMSGTLEERSRHSDNTILQHYFSHLPYVWALGDRRPQKQCAKLLLKSLELV